MSIVKSVSSYCFHFLSFVFLLVISLECSRIPNKTNEKNNIQDVLVKDFSVIDTLVKNIESNEEETTHIDICQESKQETVQAAPQYLGKFKLTYYYVAEEADYKGLEADTPLYNSDGNILKIVSQDYACALGVEGTGLLLDNRVVNYFGGTESCNKVTICSSPIHPSKICYFVLPTDLYPFGIGVKNRALLPYLSIAVDPKIIKIGTVLYVPEFDGLTLPDGSVHNGCVRADDEGGHIKGYHIDFFSFLKDNYIYFDKKVSDNVHIYIDNVKCFYEKNHFMAVGASCSQDNDCPYSGGVCLINAGFPNGYCTTKKCFEDNCPDIGGYKSFCAQFPTGIKMCVQSCQFDSDCSFGNQCRQTKKINKNGNISYKSACLP